MNKGQSLLSEDLLTVPVVVHIMHLGEDVGVGSNISDEQVHSAISKLNADLADAGGLNMNIEFKLASLDPNCEATSGILRVDASSNSDYYNIWVVTEINGNDGGGGTQGYAYFPGAGSDVDGTVIIHTACGTMGSVNFWNNQGGTLVHEIGHALNLYHTFEGDRDEEGNEICPEETNGCGSDTGDCCEDNEPHKRSKSDCPSGLNECTGADYAGVQNNFMDYSSQVCKTKFTQDQKDRMRAALLTTKASLLTSRGLSSGGTSFADAAIASCSPQTQPLGLSDFYAGIRSVTFTGRLINQGMLLKTEVTLIKLLVV